ncbi:Ig-like domain (group 3) [Candidatus Pantoea symbiotica]|uniref:Ig-like domain (Group 3) n=1 Tax=Candidatus Pantoea symbiotica TaxID=1884370 RepID=A0A1I3V1J5_9GAMM|nr:MULTISPECIES: Ig-like domain-containing protein [Pantoea]KAJ9431752.1 Ig-like domain-containing protein [Pantoea sp. YR343]SFJ88803.1 Ig-like domain (group 3) [Pantoea symbiotica]SFU62320.1 Ig-like domain (group 3) [Pantoea sp. YR525]
MANNSINEISNVNYIYTKDTDFKWTDRKALDAKGGVAEIIIDGVTYTTPISAEGLWSFTPPGGWAEGLHTLQVIIIDKATNRGEIGTYIVSVDKSAPAQPEIWRAVDNTGSDKGNLTPGDSSDERKPVLSGVAEPNSIVYLYDNTGTTPIASVKTNSMGAWTITPELSNGEHSLTVTAKDANGNESVKSPAFKLSIASGNVVFADSDAVEASHAVVAPVDIGTFAQNDGAVAPTYVPRNIINPYGENAEPNVMVQVILNNVIYTTMTTSDGKWTLPSIEIADGTYFYQIRYVDRAGNWGTAKQQILVVDGTAPEAPQIMRVVDNEGTLDYLSSNQYTNDTTPTLSGVAQPGSMVYIYGNGADPIGTVKAGDDGRWTFEPTLTADGTYVFSAQYMDRFKNPSAKSDNFIINLDSSVPRNPSLGEVYDDEGRYQGPLKSGDTTDDKTPKLSGIADSGSLVRIWDGNEIIASVVAGPRGEWSIELDLADGEHSLRVDAQSKGGNTSGKTEEFKLIVDPNILPPGKIDEIVANNGDTEIPLIDGDSTNDTTPLLRGAGNEGDIIHIIDNGVEVGTAVVDDKGKWEFELPASADGDGEHSLVVEVESGGKRSPGSDPIKIIVDTMPPTKPTTPEIIDNVGDNPGPVLPGEAIDDPRPEFNGGDADKGDTVEVIVRDENGNETVIGTAIVGEGGKWIVKPTDPIPDGEYEVIVVITDPAGNSSEESDPIKVIIDTKVPDALEAFELHDDVGPVKDLIKDGDMTDDTKPTLKGKGVDGTTVIIYDNGDEIGRVKVANGEWEFETPALPEGSHKITAQPESVSGVKGPVSGGISFTVDTTAPTTGTFDGVYKDNTNREELVGEDASINDNTLIMKGTGTNGDIAVLYGTYHIKDGNDKIIDTITLELGKATIANGAWKIETEELADQKYTFSVGIRDVAGNEAKLANEFNIEVDTTPPGPPDIGGLFSIAGLNEGLMNMSLNDIMSQGNDSLFIDNGKTQMIVSEKAGEDLKLEDILPKGEEVSNWSQANGTVTVAGVEYNVYQNNGGDAEVMVPQHLMQEQQH